jgi:hypothetical protein
MPTDMIPTEACRVCSCERASWRISSESSSRWRCWFCRSRCSRRTSVWSFAAGPPGQPRRRSTRVREVRTALVLEYVRARFRSTRLGEKRVALLLEVVALVDSGLEAGLPPERAGVVRGEAGDGRARLLELLQEECCVVGGRDLLERGILADELVLARECLGLVFERLVFVVVCRSRGLGAESARRLRGRRRRQRSTRWAGEMRAHTSCLRTYASYFFSSACPTSAYGVLSGGDGRVATRDTHGR